MSIFREYIGSLKLAEVEEYLDLLFYRPAAYLFVKTVHRTPITPNQVTLLSIVSGFVAGVFYRDGVALSFLWGGLWLAVANIMDCADGQLARMQGSGTPFGRVVDGVADYVISIVVFVGLGIGLTRMTGSADMWYLVIAAGLSAGLQALSFDFIQQQYLSAVRGERPALDRELGRVDAELGQPGERSRAPFRRFGLRLYRNYLSLQRRIFSGHRAAVSRSPGEYRQIYRSGMRWWTLMGSTTNRSVLILFSLLGYPEIYCWCTVIAGNVFLIVMLILHRRKL